MGYFIQISVGQESFQRPQEDIPSAFLILRFKDCCLILQCVEIGLHSKSPSFKQKIDTRRKPLVKMETFIFQKISGKNQVVLATWNYLLIAKKLTKQKPYFTKQKNGDRIFENWRRFMGQMYVNSYLLSSTFLDQISEEDLLMKSDLSKMWFPRCRWV